MQEIHAYVRQSAAAAKQAFYALASATTAQKNAALLRLAELIDQHQADILAANAEDMQQAAAKGLEAALLERLALTEKTIAGSAKACAKWPPCPIPWAKWTNSASAPTACKSAKCACPWA